MQSSLSILATAKWYDKTWLVIFLCTFIPPVGLYPLWKSSKFSVIWKILGSLYVAFILILSFSDKEKPANGIASEITTGNEKLLKNTLASSEWVAIDSLENPSTTYDSTDSDGIRHRGITYHKAPLLLNFTDDEARLEVPGLRGIFQLASIVHMHGTSIAGKEPKFKWDYDLDEANNTITLDNGFLGSDIKVKYENGKLYWSQWRNVEKELVFVRR